MYTKDDKNLTPPATPAKPSGESNERERSGRAFAGIIVVVVGGLLLARQAGADIPSWILSVGTLLITIGIYIGWKQRFRNWTWMIPTAIGSFFLADTLIDEFYIGHYFWPLIIISIGLILIFRPKRGNDAWKNWGPKSEENTGEDVIDATTIFGAIKKNIISKNFRGGELTSIFGGVELNLGQANINGRADLELTHIFGGAKIIVPADWTIKTDEVVCVFGGLDDKRRLGGTTPDPNKVLALNGTCIFGGIDIRSY